MHTSRVSPGWQLACRCLHTTPQLYSLACRATLLLATGRRRLELFGEDHNIRPGWVTVGNNLSSSNFNPQVCSITCTRKLMAFSLHMVPCQKVTCITISWSGRVFQQISLWQLAGCRAVDCCTTAVPPLHHRCTTAVATDAPPLHHRCTTAAPPLMIFDR